MMRTKKETIELDCGVSEVFKAFSTFSSDKFKVSEIDEENKVIVLKTSMSAWSWGEILELTIIHSDKGCSVSIRSSRRVPWNITANLQIPIDIIVQYLRSTLEISNKPY
jgi:hypothetical protein